MRFGEKKARGRESFRVKAADSETQRRKKDFGNKTQNGALSLSLEIGFCLRQERLNWVRERERGRVCNFVLVLATLGTKRMKNSLFFR